MVSAGKLLRLAARGGVLLLLLAAVVSTLRGPPRLDAPAPGTTVTGHQWSRSIEIEALHLETGEGPVDALPAGARVLSCAPKDPTGPCRYELDRWATVRTSAASGTSLRDPPRWPDAPAEANSGFGAEREGARRERYAVELRAPDGKTYRCAVPASTWSAVTVGTPWIPPNGPPDDNPDCESTTPR